MEIYILATDRFDNVAISEYSSYEVVSAGPPPPSPSILPLIVVAGVIAGLIVLVLFYMFYYKPKQTAS